jgi:hypothetical protein
VRSWLPCVLLACRVKIGPALAGSNHHTRIAKRVRGTLPHDKSPTARQANVRYTEGHMLGIWAACKRSNRGVRLATETRRLW